jgi:hypothetical protein
MDTDQSPAADLAAHPLHRIWGAVSRRDIATISVIDQKRARDQ